MKTRVCRHIKTNGRRCASPRLTGRDLCYFHAHIHQRQDLMIQTHSPIIPTNQSTSYTPAAHPIEIDLPVLEDAESIQVSISLLVAALARNRIDSKRAAVLLYGLQLASANAKSITTEPFAGAVIRNVVQSNFGTDFAVEENDLPVEEKALPAECDL
jgi:hypothetical protein